jgi:trehalose 6-phosphate synthase/phosphatase
MTDGEREERWRSNYAHISVHTASMWADHFITELNETCSISLKRNTLQPEHLDIEKAAHAFGKAEKRLIVIGYNAALTRMSEPQHRPGQRKMSGTQAHRARCAVLAW